MSKIIGGVIFLFSLIFTTPIFAAENLLQNPDFESGVSPWDSGTFGANFTTSTEFKNNGNNSGRVETTTQNSGTKYVYQVVSVEPGKVYKASGYILKQGESNSTAAIVLAFYASTDGSGSQIGGNSYSSANINSNSTSFSFVETDAIEAPSSAQSARIRLSISMPQGASQTGIAYFDDLQFTEVPPQPPSPSPSPSPSPTPTSSAQSSSPKSPTPTPKATPTQTTPVSSPQILGVESTTSATLQSPLVKTPSSTPAPKAGSSRTRIAAIATGSGAILIGLSFGFYLWYKRILRSSGA